MTEQRNASYPLRASEFIKQVDVPGLKSEIHLSEDERLKIIEFEKPLFERLKKIKELTVEDHVIYPTAFTDEKGKRLFTAIYLDFNLDQRTKDISSSREKCDQFFDNLLLVADSKEEFDKYMTRNGSIVPRLGEVSEKDIERIFRETDLTKIPDRLRARMNIYSSDWAEQKFKKDFLEAKGDVVLIQNPQRVRKIVNPGVLGEKIKELRQLKSDIKNAKSALGEHGGDLIKAQREIYSLYQSYVNVILADHFEYQNLSPRNMERVDHFLKGVGLEFDEKGQLVTIPSRLKAYSEARLIEPVSRKTDEFEKHNSVTLNADQVKIIADKVLALYGLESWKSVVLEKKGGMGVVFNKNKGTREVRIPKDFKRGIVSTLTVLAHEIEGHVLRYENKENSLKGSLLLIEDFVTGRSGVLSEGAAMWAEDVTRQEMVGMRDLALPYYYVALTEKQRGGSFKECMRASLEVRARREYGISLSDLMKDKDKFDKTFDKTYSSTSRIFRRFTDLDDTSGFLPISETLDYIEQEIVVDFLLNESKSEVMSNLLFVAGIDLYSVGNLIRMGFLDLTKVRKPQLILARVIWPKLKDALASGKELSETIKEI